MEGNPEEQEPVEAKVNWPPPAITPSGQPNVILTPGPDMEALGRSLVAALRKRGALPPADKASTPQQS